MRTRTASVGLSGLSGLSVLSVLSVLSGLSVLAVLAGHVRAQQFQFMPDQSTQPLLTTASQAGVLAVQGGDFDGDGRVDMLVPVATGLAFHRNMGGGRYQVVPSGVAAALLLSTHVYRIADFDGDSDLDVLLVEAGRAQWHQNDGTGRFLPAASIALSGSVSAGAVDIADVDGDGDADFVRSEVTGISVVLSTSATTLSRSVVAQGPSPSPFGFAVHLADIDGDGDPDLVTSSPAFSGGTQIYANDGVGGFATRLAAVPFPFVPDTINSADMDGDGDRDLVATAFASQLIMLLENQGGITFVDRSSSLPQSLLLAIPPGIVQLEDFDLDGDVDMIAGGVTVTYLRNDGAGAFADVSAQRWPTNANAFSTVRATDIDGDGDMDMALVNEFALNGPVRRVLLNHTRQLASAATPRVGGTFTLDVYSGPGYAQPALLPVLAGLALPQRPLRVPGLDGALDLDPATAVLVTLISNSAVGRSRLFLPVPNNVALVGATLFFQSGVLPIGASAYGPALGNVESATVVL